MQSRMAASRPMSLVLPEGAYRPPLLPAMEVGGRSPDRKMPVASCAANRAGRHPLSRGAAPVGRSGCDGPWRDMDRQGPGPGRGGPPEGHLSRERSQNGIGRSRPAYASPQGGRSLRPWQAVEGSGTALRAPRAAQPVLMRRAGRPAGASGSDRRRQAHDLLPRAGTARNRRCAARSVCSDRTDSARMACVAGPCTAAPAGCFRLARAAAGCGAGPAAPVCTGRFIPMRVSPRPVRAGSAVRSMDVLIRDDRHRVGNTGRRETRTALLCRSAGCRLVRRAGGFPTTGPPAGRGSATVVCADVGPVKRASVRFIALPLRHPDGSGRCPRIAGLIESATGRFCGVCAMNGLVWALHRTGCGRLMRQRS